MIEFSLLAALVAGFAGSVAMTLTMAMAGSAGMTDMPPMNLIQGAMVTGDEENAKRIGMVTHVLVMGTVVFGLGYAALFTALDTASWIAGIVIGLVHGVVAGVVFAGMGAMHPRMEPAGSLPGGDVVAHDGGRLTIAAPGAFGRNYGTMTPMGLLVGHALYGLVVALVYTALV